jgi:NTE family protein
MPEGLGRGATATLPRPSPGRKDRRAFDCVALVLQGGGALGAYQAGVYEALAEAGLEPDWIAGISIGAINAALIAGNPPKDRVERMRAFWESISTDTWSGDGWRWDGPLTEALIKGEMARGFLHQLYATTAMVHGAPNFFAPRIVPPWLQPSGSLEATSYYDTSLLRATLERLVDFDRLGAGPMRASLGAVNIRSGNFVYFDTTDQRLTAAHVMASGALPPGLPPIEIEGEFYWDGGLVSNTPLQWVVDNNDAKRTLAFQVDLWSARGEMPRNLLEVATRQKEIQYSSRTRANTDYVKKLHHMRSAVAKLLTELPENARDSEAAHALAHCSQHRLYNIVHLIYRARNYEGFSKDYDFSRLAMAEHWRAGYNDAVRTLRHKEVLEPPPQSEGVRTFDLATDGRE